MAQQLSATGESRKVRAQLRWPSGSTRSQFLGAGATLAILVGWTLFAGMSETKGFFSPLWHYAFAMGWTGVPVAFPFLVLVPVVLQFSQQLSHRWVFYARTRTPSSTYLVNITWANAWLNFLVFFAYTFISFVFFYYVVPHFGVTYDPDGITGTTDATLARLTFLVEIHPLVYAAAYSAWQGVNAVLWASVGLICVLLIRQRILAVAAPFGIFALLAMVMGLAGPPLAWNTPWLMWVLFSTSGDFLPSVPIIGAMCAVVAIVLGLTIRHSDRLGVLQ